MTDNSILKARRKYLRHLDRFARPARSVFDKKMNREASAHLIEDVRGEFEDILPQVPDIGGKQPFTDLLAFTGMYLAFYRVMKAQGYPTEQAGCLIWEINSSIMEAMPRIVLKLFGKRIFTPAYSRNLMARAEKSQAREYSGDYVYEYVPGGQGSFDFGVDYLECGGVKFLRQMGAPELAPYLCPVDRIYSRMFNWGLKRTTTLAEGGPRCDFRFKQGGATEVAVPAALENYLKE